MLADVVGPYPSASFVGYDAAIDARIVVDPATLLPYAREERIQWYIALGKQVSETMLESDHIVSRTRYGTGQLPASPRLRERQSLIPRPQSSS